MKRAVVATSILVFVLLTALAVKGLQRSASSASASTIEAAVTDYRKWTRLTAEPINISPMVLGLCRLPTKEETALIQSDHKDRFINVYVNRAGEALIRETGRRQFPTGTVIVKEKLKSKTDVSPTALGIMLKRSADDWEFAFQENGRISRGESVARCRTCHSMQSERDQVFYPRPFPSTR